MNASSHKISIAEKMGYSLGDLAASLILIEKELTARKSKESLCLTINENLE